MIKKQSLTLLASLKKAREAAGISQRSLAALVGMPQSHISKIEAGKTDIRLSTLIELADALGLDVTCASNPVRQHVNSKTPTKTLDKTNETIDCPVTAYRREQDWLSID
jgi:transcriptional regulator with XRE-family HTH domain